ncbi:MAG TPA: hypothetical protein VHA33_03230 [Candidatus Angelobacter sp.]|jgi:hypothetical protein|nr:hypothetical protein [Candidatus Angelobacter sp.]
MASDTCWTTFSESDSVQNVQSYSLDEENAVKSAIEKHMKQNIRFARLTFLIAGFWGLIIIVPGFFAENMVNKQFPPAISHPEFYYGFFGTAFAWQIAFFIVSKDPLRMRALIPAAVVEKLAYAIAIAALFLSGRIAAPMAIFGAIDLLFGILFAVAYLKLGRGEPAFAQAH